MQNTSPRTQAPYPRPSPSPKACPWTVDACAAADPSPWKFHRSACRNSLRRKRRTHDRRLHPRPDRHTEHEQGTPLDPTATDASAPASPSPATEPSPTSNKLAKSTPTVVGRQPLLGRRSIARSVLPLAQCTGQHHRHLLPRCSEHGF